MTAQPLGSGFSFGGGQQSTACLILAAQGRIDFRTFYFANVGDDSELPATLRYIEEYAKPYAAERGLELVELRRIMQSGTDKGQERTLLQDLKRPGSSSINIPMRMANGAPGTRACTERWKRRLIARETRRRGATPENPATVGIGISVDEVERAKDSNISHQLHEHPLLDLGLRRTDCQRIIRAAGLPIPPKSACWFCPMKRPEDWQNQRREEPTLFAAACQLEADMIARRATLTDKRTGKPKDPVYLTRFNRPLAEAIPDGVDLLPMFDETDGACDSGYCFT